MDSNNSSTDSKGSLSDLIDAIDGGAAAHITGGYAKQEEPQRVYRDGAWHERLATNKLRELDPTGRDAHAPGAKLDAGKYLPWLCISGFAHALAAVADVTTKGARKYTPNGWASVPDGEERYMEAFARHTLALARGEQIDVDTGCLHKAQMAWNILASLELDLREANKVGKG